MSGEALRELAREATADFNALLRIQALDDEALRRLGLEADDIAAVRGGYFERLAQAGSFDGDNWRPNGCCA